LRVFYKNIDYKKYPVGYENQRNLEMLPKNSKKTFNNASEILYFSIPLNLSLFGNRGEQKKEKIVINRGFASFFYISYIKPA